LKESYQKPPNRNPQRSAKHRTALKFGSKIPVFPCREDKTPYTPNGFKDASTDPRRITAYWNKHTNANPAAPTGEESGFFVLDVDKDKWGFGSLEALEAEHGPLPKTYTVQTGRGGLHIYLRYPEGADIRNSAGKLGPGLDVRGEGGYVLLPGSVTEGTYTVLDKRPIADAPAWLVELAREPRGNRLHEETGWRHRSATNPSADGPPIRESDPSRDVTLASIAGKLHDGTRALPDLEAELLQINEARCVPPLPEPQVQKIARSIYRRKPCKPSPPEPDKATLEALAAIEAATWHRRWRGMGGKSERDTLVALIKQARRNGQMIPAGVRVSISVRALALAAAVSKRAMLDSWKAGVRKPGIISRLKRAGLIRSDSAGRGGVECGAFVLVVPRAQFHHSTTTEHLRGADRSSGETLRAPRLRWSSPANKGRRRGVVKETRRVRQSLPGEPRAGVKRLGKGCGQVIDALERSGGSATLEELAAALGTGRVRDLRRRLITRLEAAAVVECSEASNTVALVGDWLDALNRERERAGEIADYRRDMARYAREREAYANRHRTRPDPIPEKPPAGEISELGRVPEAGPVLVGALATYLKRNPHRRHEPPSWLGVAVWSESLTDFKPSPEQVEAALAELPPSGAVA
jgi:Bifunctional DNA primase/polymerase, N-terminal/Primase C terminal 1 (PriCT-1)